MRTSILCAAFLGLFAAGCAGDLSGTGGGDDTQPSENCGNGTVDTGETCDDSNTSNGDGCSSSCTTESTGGTPRVMATVDKATVMTQLGKTETVTITLQGLDGFEGDVTIAPSIVDGAQAPIAGMTVTGPATLTVPATGTVTGMYAVEIPSNATGTDLTATLKLDLNSSAGAESITSVMSVAAIFTVTYMPNTAGTVALHPIQSGAVTNAVTVKRGTKIRFVNSDTVRHITHGGGFFPHEDQTNGGPAGGTYELPTLAAAPGQTGQLGCHETNHGGTAGYVTFTME